MARPVPDPQVPFDPPTGRPARSRVALAFGPVPSRRLGRSLGINNVPPKVCSYGCVYCQVGATPSPQLEPRTVYPPERLVRAVARHVEAVRVRGEAIDHLAFVPDGEPTLDANLGLEIDLLRRLGIPIAVISNGSLAWRPEVRAALRAADWASVKVDAVDERVWRRVNRPPSDLALSTVLDGIRALAARFPGDLASETMLVEGMNDDAETLRGVAAFLGDVGISTAFVAIPTRPPAEPWARPPDEAVVVRAHRILAERVRRVEYLVGYEGDAFASTGNARADLLSITAVHPMRDSAVCELLGRTGSERAVVDDLIRDGLVVFVEYRGERFLVRAFHTRTRARARSGPPWRSVGRR